MNPVGRRVTKPGKASQIRESPFPHFHQIYQNHHLSFSQHKRLGYIKLNIFFHFITSRSGPGIQRPYFLQCLHPESLLLAASASYSLTTKSVRTVLGLSRPGLKRQHRGCSQSMGQTQGHGPYPPGNSFFCAPGRGKGIGGLLTSLGRSCLRDIFDISNPWHVPFATLLAKASATEQRTTSIVPCVQSLLDENPTFFLPSCSF